MSGFSISSNSQKPPGVGGKFFISLFFLVFLGAGCFFVWQIARDAVVGVRVWSWKATPCQILSSAVAEDGTPGQGVGNFSLAVKYQYSFGGRTFTSEQYARNPKPSSDYGKVARLAERYRPGTSAICYVNPSDPAEAVLVRENLLALLFVLLPMLFVAVGAGGLYSTWRPRRAQNQAASSISELASPTRGQRMSLLFFSVFLLAGLGFLYGFFLRPLAKIIVSSNWPAVPCVVLSSEVQSHRDSDGSTYSINILYSYEFSGRAFKSNRYHFLGGSSSGYAGKRAVVNRYPPGFHTLCYVNPSEPTEAVLERGFTADMWFGLIPFVFVLIGGGGVTYSLRQRKRASAAPGSTTGAYSAPAPGGASTFANAMPSVNERGTTALKPRTAPFVKVIAATGIALFWNGIVSVFLFDVIGQWRSNHHDFFTIFLTLFLTPFVLVGLGLIGAIFYFLLALFNPRPRLRITPGSVPLGGTLRVEWEIAGNTQRLGHLSVRLRGREEATYQRGTNTSTDTNVFSDLEIAEVTAWQEMQSGNRTVTIPPELMHSFTAQHNKIVWSIQMHGNIPRWPDLREEFRIVVLPREGKKSEP